MKGLSRNATLGIAVLVILVIVAVAYYMGWLSALGI